MKLEEFNRDLQSARERAEKLQYAATEQGGKKDELLLEAIEELQTTLAELQVSQEELRQQNDELIIIRSDAEFERQKYQDLFEFAPDAYFLTDNYGKILEANQAAASMFKLRANLLIGKPVVSFVAESNRAALRTELNRLLENEDRTFAEIDLSMTPRVGDYFEGSLKIAISRDKAARTVRLRWLIRDITEKIKTENSLRELNAELEERVRRRTAELEQANALKSELLVREQQARADAEAANRAKDEFLAIASHELRTPLTAIQGWAEMLTSGNLDESTTRRGFETIARNVRAQTQIIKDLLDVSRIISGKLQLETRRVELIPVLEATIDIVRPAAKVAGVTLHQDFDSDADPVLGDASRLQQVVWNLASNAIKFTPPGGTVYLRLRRENNRVAILVEDTGVGIEPKFLPHVFDLFRQSDSRTTRKFGGLGLGLAIVRSLVESHGGTVTAHSAGAGLGATFIISLPTVSDWAERERNPVNPSFDVLFTSGARETTLEGIRVLVVDDDKDSRGMLEAALELHGADVETSSSAVEGIDKLETIRPDVIVSDIGMPNEDGYYLIRTIRELPPERGGKTPAVALTGYASRDDQIKALAEGYQMHLPKPVEITKLVTILSQLAKQHEDGSPKTSDANA